MRNQGAAWLQAHRRQGRYGSHRSARSVLLRPRALYRRELLARLVLDPTLAVGFLAQRRRAARPVALARGLRSAADRGRQQPRSQRHLRLSQSLQQPARQRLRQLPPGVKEDRAVAGDGRLSQQRQQRDGAQRRLRPDRLHRPGRRQDELGLLAAGHPLPLLRRRHGAAGGLPQCHAAALVGQRQQRRQQHCAAGAGCRARQPDVAPQHRALRGQAVDPVPGLEQPEPGLCAARLRRFQQRPL